MTEIQTEKIWDSFLRNKTSGLTTSEATIIVLGDWVSESSNIIYELQQIGSKNLKLSFLDNLKDSFCNGLLNYYYLNVLKTEDVDENDCPSLCHVWILKNELFEDLLSLICNKLNLKYTMILICVDLTQVCCIKERFNKWFEISNKLVKILLQKKSVNEQQELLAKNNCYLKDQFLKTNESDFDVPINLGIPIVVCIHKVLETFFPQKVEDICLNYFRQVAYQYGAAICVYSPTKVLNEHIYKYCLHRLFGVSYTPLLLKNPKYMLFPSGFESKDSLRALIYSLDDFVISILQNGNKSTLQNKINTTNSMSDMYKTLALHYPDVVESGTLDNIRPKMQEKIVKENKVSKEVFNNIESEELENTELKDFFYKLLEKKKSK